MCFETVSVRAAFLLRVPFKFFAILYSAPFSTLYINDVRNNCLASRARSSFSFSINCLRDRGSGVAVASAIRRLSM